MSLPGLTDRLEVLRRSGPVVNAAGRPDAGPLLISHTLRCAYRETGSDVAVLRGLPTGTRTGTATVLRGADVTDGDTVRTSDGRLWTCQVRRTPVTLRLDLTGLTRGTVG